MAARAEARGSLRCRVRAFTLVELMVVIGIIAIVMALALPAATSLVAGTRAKQTGSTMKVLQGAIEGYAYEKPLQSNPVVLREIVCNSQAYTQRYKDVFGPYPPSPTAPFAPDPANLQNYTMPWTDETDPETSTKYLRLLDAYLNYWPISLPRPAEDFASIECLLVFMSRLSPQARQIVDQLPSSAKTNKDRSVDDLVFEDRNNNDLPDADEPRVDLFEIVDAWGHPLRYAVRPPYLDITTCEVSFPAIWELRSAGPDGRFSAPWTDEDQSDDVILRSQ